MTNLLQPADLAWFSSIKKAYRKKWNHWFTFENKSFTVNCNMKSPGYVNASNWISQIWEELSQDMVKNSFDICGIHKNHLIDNEEIHIQTNNLHSIIKKMLLEQKIFHGLISDDSELAEADKLMNNNKNSDIFALGR